MADATNLLIVVAAALMDADGRFLMQRWPAHKMHGGLWELPGGKIEPGESPEAALVRELAEELTVTVAPVDLAPLTFSTTLAGERTILLLLYVCTRWTGAVRAVEADEMIWRRPADLCDLPMPPADVPLVAALAAYERHASL